MAVPTVTAPPQPKSEPQPARRVHKTRYQQEEEAMGGPIQRPTDVLAHGHWRFGRMIGKGASGRVKIAQHALTGELACVKIVPKSAVLSSRLSLAAAAAGAAEKDERLLMAIEREIAVMKLVDHPNLVKLLDVWETQTDMYMLLEYVASGELFDHICARGRLPPAESVHFFAQIIRGVAYCHALNVAHRDLKPENLLLDGRGGVKIADFGMAVFQRAGALLETSCGSPHYASPEIVSGKAYDGATSDIWSCGVILYALLTGRLPFDDPNIRNLLRKVKDGRFTIPDYVPPEAQDLLRRMIEVDPGHRIKMPAILSHPFLFPSHLGAPASIHPFPPCTLLLSLPVPPSALDASLIKAMRALWRNRDADDIVCALTDPTQGQNWEKVFYFLLMRYRERVEARAVSGRGVGVITGPVEESSGNSSGSNSDSNPSTGTPTPKTRVVPLPISPHAALTLAKTGNQTPTPAPVRLQQAHKPSPLIPAASIQPTPKPSKVDAWRVQVSTGSEDIDMDVPAAPHSGSPISSRASSDGSLALFTDDNASGELNLVLDICASSTRPAGIADPFVSVLPPIVSHAPFDLGLPPITSVGVGLGLSFGPTVKSLRSPIEASDVHMVTASMGSPPKTLPSTVLGLNIPEVRTDDVAMRAFLMDLKRRVEDAEARANGSTNLAAQDVVMQSPSVANAPAPALASGIDETSDWTTVPRGGAVERNTPPTRGGLTRRRTGGARPIPTRIQPRRNNTTPATAPLPIPQPQRGVMSPHLSAPPDVQSPRPRHIQFSSDLAAAPVRLAPSSPAASLARRTTLANPSSRRHSTQEDKENQRAKLKERRNTGLGLGLPIIAREAARKVSEVPMPGAFSGMAAGCGKEKEKESKTRKRGRVDLTAVDINVPFTHPNGAIQYTNKPSRPQSSTFSPSFPAAPTFGSNAPPITPSSGMGSDPKSWLASFFSWKGEKYEVLSGMGVAETRQECQRLLTAMDVHSQFEETASGEWGLRCWTRGASLPSYASRDINASCAESMNSSWYKPVRFRIEFHPAPPTPPPSTLMHQHPIGAGFHTHYPNAAITSLRTTMTLVHEKGAAATFKAVYARVRNDWGGAGGLKSPEMGMRQLDYGSPVMGVMGLEGEDY